jgi:nucleotide sugar dehydrogenase
VKVAVVGLGKIGLPLAALYAEKGAEVIGCDVNPEVVRAVNAGVSPFGAEPGLVEKVASAYDVRRLRATDDTAVAVADSDIVVLIVRVGLDEGRQPDYTQLDAAADAVGHGLKRGTLIVLESTVPVGATRKHLSPKLREASGLPEGAFRLAYSPERVSSGTIFSDLGTYPKLVGGVDELSGAAAVAFYRSMLDAPVMLLPDAETAEFAKLAESIYRDVNIALANELAKAAEALGVDYGAAKAASNSQPYSHLHDPGLGVGGHCIPVYPYFLTSTVEAPLIELGREVNDSMAQHAVECLSVELGGLEGQTVLILGLAYRGGVKEAAFSSTILVAAEARRRGARVLVHDPLFSDVEMAAYELQGTALPPSEPVAAVVLQAMHTEYADLDLTALKGCRVFLDGRAAFDRTRVEAAGMKYIAIGGGTRS